MRWANLRRKRVLVVDDEAAVRAAIRQHLRLMGYEAVEAATSDAALAFLQEEVPDLVLLDVMLGEVHGWDILTIIRNDVRLAKVPVVMVSALGEPHHVQESLDRGANDHLQKPFNPNRLVQLVGELVHRRTDDP